MSFKFIQRCVLATLLCGSVTAPAVAQEAAFQAIEQAAFQVDETTPLQPARQAFEDPVGPSPAAREFANTVLASRTQPSTLLSPQRRRHIRSNSDVVFGSEAKFRVSTDTGNLLGESPYAAGVQAPILVGGAALFGMGWGLAGFCPGPGIVSLVSGSSNAVLFVVAMTAGMLLMNAIDAVRARARNVAVAQSEPTKVT